jgi:hypothetical protein
VQARRNVDALCRSGFDVDHQFERGRLKHRRVGGLGPLEDAIDVTRRAPVLVGKIRTIGNQAAGGGGRFVGSRPRAAALRRARPGSSS